MELYMRCPCFCRVLWISCVLIGSITCILPQSAYGQDLSKPTYQVFSRYCLALAVHGFSASSSIRQRSGMLGSGFLLYSYLKLKRKNHPRDQYTVQLLQKGRAVTVVKHRCESKANSSRTPALPVSSLFLLFQGEGGTRQDCLLLSAYLFISDQDMPWFYVRSNVSTNGSAKRL